VGVRAEVAEQDGCRTQVAYPLHALNGQLQIELGRGSGGAQDSHVGKEHAQRVSDEHPSARGVRQRHVVAGVTRRVDDVEGARAELDPVTVTNRSQALTGNRMHRTEHLIQLPLPVDTRGTGHELRGVGKVRLSTLVDPHGGPGEVWRQRPGPAGMVQMYVSDDYVGQVLGADPEGIEPSPNRLRRGGGGRLHQGWLGRLHEVAGRDLLAPAHHRVDRPDPLGCFEGRGHGAESNQAAGRVGGGC
jgi:hypothetical protein